MLTTFLVIIFSELTFANVTVQELVKWYDCHPFAAIIAIQDIILGALILFRIFNEFVSLESHEEDISEDPSSWVVYTNNTKDKE